MAAWEGAGLTEERCYMDATKGAATEECTVDVWACTAECIKHSRRGRASRREAAAAFVRLDMSLDYVRRQKPRVVIIENVCDRLLIERLGVALGEIVGYRWRHLELSPHELGGAMERERAFWIGTAL